MTVGIIFAFVALFAWGVGDFLIQRSTRRFGDIVSLFYITAFAAIVLTPFVIGDIAKLLFGQISPWLLLLTGLVILVAALFDLEALRIGKISVIEPIYAFEILVTAMLASFLLQEHLSLWQVVMIISLFLGILLVAIRSLSHFKDINWERGVWYAFLGMLGMGASNFLYGLSARADGPLLINWFASLFMALATLIILLYQKRLRELMRDWQQHKKLILSVSFFDTLAWVAFAASAVYIPIAIATGISESYIALAAGLGIIFNKEKLKFHQKTGLVLTVLSAVALALVTK